jgi:hypothetical protein
VDRSSRRAFQGTQRRILVFEVLLAASSAELSVNAARWAWHVISNTSAAPPVKALETTAREESRVRRSVRLAAHSILRLLGRAEFIVISPI